LAAWLSVLEALRLGTGRPVYRVMFDFWLKYVESMMSKRGDFRSTS
jgi:hypothetical protein